MTTIFIGEAGADLGPLPGVTTGDAPQNLVVQRQVDEIVIAAEEIQIGSDSGTCELGFYGVTPVTRPNVSSSANVATLITALGTLGIINVT